MCNHWAGMALTNNGEIGPQGSPLDGSDNVWLSGGGCAPWTSALAFYQTYCDNSDPSLSPIYAVNAPQYNPTFHGGTPPFGPYQNGNTVVTASAHTPSFWCQSWQQWSVPNWRAEITTDIENVKDSDDTGGRIYPNPVGDFLFIECSESEYSIRLMDLTGKIIYENSSSPDRINTSTLDASVYLIEIKTKKGISRQKVIKIQ
jgi:hypothetical protein